MFVHWQGLVQAALLRRRRETEYVDVYHERCQVCICICICKYMDERQNMWTFIMSFVRFARSNTSPIKHSLINAMIRLLIFPNRKEEKIGGRSRGAVWGGAICKYSVLTVHRYQIWDLYCKHWIYQTKLTHCIVSKAIQPPSLSPEPYWMMSITCVEDQIFGEILLSQNEAVEPLREEKEEGNWSLFDDHIDEQIDQRRTKQIVWRQTSKSTEGKPTKWPKTN